MTARERNAIFGIGKALGLDHEGLRGIASQYNGGKYSVGALSDSEAKEMKRDLFGQLHKDITARIATDEMIRRYNRSRRLNSITRITRQTIKMLVLDYLNWSRWEFIAWLMKWFHVPNLRWLSENQGLRIIYMLTQQLARA